jgi:hypothetical protein
MCFCFECFIFLVVCVFVLFCVLPLLLYIAVSFLFLYKSTDHCGPGSVVDITTGSELDGPGIESRCGRDFPHLSRPALGPTQPPIQWVQGLSPGVNSGRGVTLTPHPLLVALVMKE